LEPLTAIQALVAGKKIMPRADTAANWTELTLEERRERRRIRREKQREDNVKRAAKMHAARIKTEGDALAGGTGNGGILFMRVWCRTTGSGNI
jgi:urease accessory protein UreE